jgi:hypothetical protein
VNAHLTGGALFRFEIINLVQINFADQCKVKKSPDEAKGTKNDDYRSAAIEGEWGCAAVLI